MAYAANRRAQKDSFAAIAAKLNVAGFRTRKSSLWASVQVKPMLDRSPA
ncbi:recombinase family protein (plasmid) [Deinococcus taeanensis]|nr:recombinase family protein [Deinococcus taeanensis]UBV44282.1 recombinase family protein [Deinococcus taeanensis]